MMGRQEFSQNQLFYSFNLEAVVPADHILRGIDEHLDLSSQRDHLQPFYSHTGRPSVDPELLIRMLIVGSKVTLKTLPSVDLWRDPQLTHSVFVKDDFAQALMKQKGGKKLKFQPCRLIR